MMALAVVATDKERKEGGMKLELFQYRVMRRCSLKLHLEPLTSMSEGTEDARRRLGQSSSSLMSNELVSRQSPLLGARKLRAKRDSPV